MAPRKNKAELRRDKKYGIQYSRRNDRVEACRLAAQVVASRPDCAPSPLLWSLAVFFETYIGQGSGATYKEFGPKKPVKLRVVKKESASE